MTSHVISSSVLFPLLWLIIGSIGKSLLISQNLINQPLADAIYYLVMLLMFYFGIKYSLYYINKNVSVAMPKQSEKQSIILFTSLVLAVNYGLYYFEDSLNIMRIIFSFALIYMFIIMTKKYFDSLEDSEYIECTFIGQVLILLANTSIVITLLTIYGIISNITPYARYIVVIISIVVALKTDLFKHFFVAFFYRKNEKKPLKHALTMLVITLPINIALYILLSNYFAT